MKLNFGFQIQDLYDAAKLLLLQDRFLGHLQATHPDLYQQVYASQASVEDYLIPLAMAIETFVVELFHLQADVQPQYDIHHTYRLTSHFKRNFIQRDALHAHAHSSANAINAADVLAALSKRLGQVIDPSDEVTFAQLGLAALNRNDEPTIRLFRQYAAWAFYSEEGKIRHKNGFLFKKPSSINLQQRFPVNNNNDVISAPKTINRTGFDLTDAGMDTPNAVDEAFYCIKCHERSKDTCRTGFVEDQGQFKTDALDQPLSGCPLDQKISEMNLLFEHGQLIAALAVVVLDNPMVAATGHRICYECSRSCIFQKQDPVDIPSIETRLLKNVLNLPYGFEIYSLLTRWNPLNLDHPYPKNSSGYHVLVVGQGPSGFALAHLLMQQGHRVTAIDGLKIDPLPMELKDTTQPIRDIADYYEALSQRYAKGFGGVAEYGITARWDKNFLFVIRLLLERRSQYTCIDGVRFGSSLNIVDAFDTYGFDHIALCLGAGLPTILPLDNITIPGVRLASDVLMALHLGDSAKLGSKTPLRIQLPVAVIGAGLTAVDAATEALAYYPIQVRHFYQRYKAVLEHYGQKKALEILDVDPEVAATFLHHGKLIDKEYLAAKHEGREPDYLQYLNAWGGVTLYYRNALQSAPSYRLNPNELKNALAEGVRFVEHAVPVDIIAGKDNRLAAVTFKINEQQPTTLPIKTLLIAAGTKPNTVLAEELSELELEGSFFRPINKHPFFVAASNDGRYVSYLGDLHPQYTGSVVKALASAKAAAPLIDHALSKRSPYSSNFPVGDFISIVNTITCAGKRIDLSIRSPAAAKAYQPGQFFKLHPYGIAFTEAIPLSPVHVDKHNGIIYFNVQIAGATTHALQTLVPKQRVFLMGPAGSAFNVSPHQKVLFVVDPQAPVDVTAPIQQYLKNPSHQLIMPVSMLDRHNFLEWDVVFVAGSTAFIEQFKNTFCDIGLPCYTFVYTHLQCMMKQVCAQCVYTIKDPSTGMTSIQFGCAKSIEAMDKISYSAVNKRNKNEQLEERLLDLYNHIEYPPPSIECTP